MPAVELERALSFETHPEIGPADRVMEAELGVPEIQAVARPFVHIFNAGHDGAVRRLGIDPSCQAEGVEIIEVGYLARIHEEMAVETAGHPYLARRERQGASPVRSAAYHRPFRIISAGFLLVPARLAAGRIQPFVDAGFLPQAAVQREAQDQAIAHVPIRHLRVANPKLPCPLTPCKLRMECAT